MHPLDLVLLGTVHPPIAQLLGLYWLDRDVHPASSYDYLVVADHANVASGSVQNMLARIQQADFTGVDAWITFDKRLAAGPPLPPPTNVRAFALPGGTYRARGGANAPINRADGNVGLTWNIDRLPSGHLAPGRAVLFHVWRDRQGNGATATPSAEAGELLTGGRPQLVSSPLEPPAEPMRFPSDWPPFPLRYVDFALAEGWYGYQVNSVDLFGRFSQKSAFAPWRQWVPPPTPLPWYYADPPDREVDAASVRIRDKTSPPPPMAVEAFALDPDDPLVIRDDAHTAWRQSLLATDRSRIVGLRVRWRWTVAQQRQAPDTAAFRLYWNPGSQPPDTWEDAASWSLRCHVCSYADNVRATDGNRTYEVFLPVADAGGPFATGIPLAPTLADPVVYANVTVTAVDDSSHTPDPRGGAAGNESRAAAPQRVYRVRREAPARPPLVVDSGLVYATPADWHGRSYHTFRWQEQSNLAVQIFRAMDEAVFLADWAMRPREPDLSPGQNEYFPDIALEPTWTIGKRQPVCDALNALDDFDKDTGKADALRAYRALSDDALRVLAGLPGCAKAFVQITMKPLEPTDAAWADRRGPDDPAGYAPRARIRAYLDTLDGRAANRYLYCAVNVDLAQNRSLPGPIGTLVRLPKVVAPRPPRVTKVVAGEKKVILTWASNREPDLLEYRVYRASTAKAASDLRLMTLVGAPVPADRDPAARPASVEWTDDSVPGLTDLWYRVVAVDRIDTIDPRAGGGNVSEPSPVVKARATQTPPAPPALQVPVWDTAHTGVRLTWQVADASLESRIERRTEPGARWVAVSGWLAAGQTTVADTPADPARSYDYRVRVRDHAGQQGYSAAQTTP